MCGWGVGAGTCSPVSVWPEPSHRHLTAGRQQQGSAFVHDGSVSQDRLDGFVENTQSLLRNSQHQLQETQSQSVNVCGRHDTCREMFLLRESNKEMASNIDVLRRCVDVTDSSTVTTQAESLMMTFCVCMSAGSVLCSLFPPQYHTHVNGGLNEKLNIVA